MAVFGAIYNLLWGDLVQIPPPGHQLVLELPRLLKHLCHGETSFDQIHKFRGAPPGISVHYREKPSMLRR